MPIQNLKPLYIGPYIGSNMIGSLFIQSLKVQEQEHVQVLYMARPTSGNRTPRMNCTSSVNFSLVGVWFSTAFRQVIRVSCSSSLLRQTGTLKQVFRGNQDEGFPLNTPYGHLNVQNHTFCRNWNECVVWQLVVIEQLTLNTYINAYIKERQ